MDDVEFFGMEILGSPLDSGKNYTEIIAGISPAMALRGCTIILACEGPMGEHLTDKHGM